VGSLARSFADSLSTGLRASSRTSIGRSIALDWHERADVPIVIPFAVAFRAAFHDTALMSTAAVIALTFGVVMLASQEAGAQMIRLGDVLVLTPSDGTSAPDGKDHLVQADRGNRKGQFYRVWTGAAKTGTPPATDRSTEYRLLSPEKAGPLPDVDVLGIHFIKVLPDRRDAFERFVRDTLHPAVANLRPDLRLLYYKAVRGAEAPGYILLFALTKQSRDKYWPGGSDSDVLRAAFAPVKVHTKELSTYLVPDSALTDEKFAAAIYESREWTDLVLVGK
jgi:hypothetical protein